MSAGEGPLASFGVAVSYVDGQTVVAVQGEVDVVTAPGLGGIVDVVGDAGHPDVVLDLAALEFMDAAGLRVIAGAARRLRALEGGLTVRSASAMVRRILDITALTDTVCLEPSGTAEVPEGAGNHLGAEQTAAVPGTPVVEPDRVAPSLRRLGSIPADDDVVDGALRLVVAVARAAVAGADGVSVSLARRGRLATVAATDLTVSDMDADQYATGEGPCVDASVTGRWFHAESLEAEDRWPAFTPKARQLGINAILSSPLLARDRPVGALNIYSRTPGAFDNAAQQLASMFASEVSVILADAGVDVTDDALAERLGQALAAREVIAQAQGALMERHGIPAADAYDQLRRASQATNIPLGQGAAETLASTRLRAGPEHGSPTVRRSHG